MAISFPSSPTTGDLYTYNNKTWQYNGEGWITYPYQNDGAIAYAASDYGYQRAMAVRNANLVVNTSCMVAQEYAPDTAGTAAASGAEYRADQMVVSWSVSTSTLKSAHYSTPSLAGYNGFVGFIGTAAVTYAAGNYAGITHQMEGYFMAHLKWGASGAKDLRVGFWFYATNSGTYCAAIRNVAATRSYVRTFTYTTGDTWQFIELTYPGETSGAWNDDYQEWGGIFIGGATGSTYQTTADAWQTGSYVAVSGATNAFQAANDEMFVTGLVMVPSEITFPSTNYMYLTQRLFPEELKLCQRYYQKSWNYDVAVGTITNQGAQSVFGGSTASFFKFPVEFRTEMRGSPTGTIYSSNTGTSGKIYNQTVGTDDNATYNNQGSAGMVALVNNVSRTDDYFWFHWTANARL